MAETLSDFIAAFFNPKQQEPMDVVLGCTKRSQKTEREDEDTLGHRILSVESLPAVGNETGISEDGSDLNILPIRDLQPAFKEDSYETRRYNREESRKLSELQLVEYLREWKGIANKKSFLIGEADIYKTHPGVLTQGLSSRYFITSTRYTPSQRPRRLRKTENGCRWRQQGRCNPINENGTPVAYKTNLSYVPLKDTLNRQSENTLSFGTPDTNFAFYLKKDESSDESLDGTRGKREVRKWAIWTMEEIILAEDLDEERRLLKKNHKPEPVPIICRILCKRDSYRSRRSSCVERVISSFKVKTEDSEENTDFVYV